MVPELTIEMIVLHFINEFENIPISFRNVSNVILKKLGLAQSIGDIGVQKKRNMG